MKIHSAGKRIPTGGKNMLPVFCAGLAAGILMISLGKSILLEHTGLFDEDTLYRMKYITVDGSALFCYVFRKRMTALLIMAVLFTTYLGYAACVGAAAWYGMSVGVFVSVLMTRYGIKGLVLAVISVFPQMFFYVPAVIMLLGWGESLYRAIYSRGLGIEAADRIFVAKKMGWLGVIAGVTALGCVMEGYINPKLLLGYLKVF